MSSKTCGARGPSADAPLFIKRDKTRRRGKIVAKRAAAREAKRQGDVWRPDRVLAEMAPPKAETLA